MKNKTETRLGRLGSLELESLMANVIRLFRDSWLWENHERDGQKLVSLALVGRPVIMRKIDRVMDLDLVVLIKDPMTSRVLEKVRRIFDNVMNRSHKRLHVKYALADGPIKPIPDTDFTFFCHVLLHTVSSLNTSPLKLVKAEWLLDSLPLLGLPLREVIEKPNIDSELVLNGLLGLDHCRKLLGSQETSCLIWKPIEGDEVFSLDLVPMKFNERCERFELAAYSVLRGASNSIKIINNSSEHVGIGWDMIRIFRSNLLSPDIEDIPGYFLTQKTKLRAGEWYPGELECSLAEEMADEFLGKLQIKIQSFHYPGKILSLI